MKDITKIYIVVASSLMLLITMIYQGVYAYFEAEVIHAGVRNTSIATKNLKDLQIIDGTTSSSDLMIPGESITQTFQVKNENDMSVCFNLNWENVVNTFVNTNDLHVSLNDGTSNTLLTLNTFPTTSATLASGMKINASTTSNYTLTVTYVETESDQTGDMGKKFSGRITGEIVECPANEVTLAKLQKLNPDIKLNESMNDQTGVCPTYDPITKTIQVTAGEENASLLCEAEDDFGTTYYYRGNVTNNYVSFAGFIWRIVRINGDGSIRLIYDGTQAYANIKEGGSTSDGTNRQIGTRAFNPSMEDNAYLGYMYKGVNQSSYAATFDVMNNKNAPSSYIKGDATTSGSIDYWYANNIDIAIPSSTKKYSDYVSLDSIFCNDKNISETTPDGYTTDGYAKQATSYRWHHGPWLAAESGQQQPRFTCVNTQGTVDSKNDAFSVSATGNGALTYPVALITTDEAVTAGGYSMTTSHYLRTGSGYWTMSAHVFNGSYAWSGYVSSSGIPGFSSLTNAPDGIRPVLSLKPDVVFSLGDGTMNHPFVVKID